MRFFIATLLLSTISASLCATTKPNILVILADDMGYSDLGCYGSEIATPNLDRLAAKGLRFTSFYNSAKCEPTRSSLMSGQYWQDCGLGVKNGFTMGQAMQLAGYDTFAIGKWHLDGNPVERGFDHYFGHLGGGSDYFKGSSAHRLDLKPFKPSSDRSFYTTDANADYAIKFISEAHEQHPEKPFFMYLAFNAPHASLQAKAEDIARYRGKYRIGWDKLREQRYQKQIAQGITKKEWALSPRPDTIPAWDLLTPEEQEFEDVRMAVYAAQVDCMDQAIGRVLAQVKHLGEEENTLVIFLSDNGASPYDHGKVTDRRIEPLLDGTSHLGYGLGWANVSATPFRHYKRNMFNGGSSTACIASWPAVVKRPGSISDQCGHIIDLMATIVDVGGGSWPTELAGTKIAPLPGKSLAPILADKQRESHDVLYFQLFDHRAVIAGNMKLVSDWRRPAELFNLAMDRTELHDLSKEQPAELARLEKLWSEFATKTKIRLRSAGGEPIYRRLADVTEKFVGGRSDGGDDERVEMKGKGKQGNAKHLRSTNQDKAIRARKDTKLTITEGQLILTSTGTDSGMTFDTSDVKVTGPYTLTFRAQCQASGEGEVFWTHDANTTLPKGQHQVFPVTHDGQWHDVFIKLNDAKVMHALRIDLCSGTGKVRIEGLRLNGASGKTLKQWP